jgi:hypothetical protein
MLWLVTRWTTGCNKRDSTMKSLVQIVSGTWIFLIKIFIPGFEDFVGYKTKMYCFDRVKYKFHTRFRNPNVQVSIGSCGICIRGFNMWPWPIEPMVMVGVNQQPPMHQFKMRPFKPFWGWTKNTSSSPARGFFSPLLYPKIFPSCLLPPALQPTSPFPPPSPHFLLTLFPKIKRAPKLE